MRLSEKTSSKSLSKRELRIEANTCLGDAKPDEPTPQNATMMQAFEWYVAADGKHFRRLTRDVPALDTIGISALWIPPACKGGGPDDNGYGIYGIISPSIDLIIDLWDLGEFDQKGTTRTKWGTEKELKDLAKVIQEKKMKLYFDAVLNHKAAADEKEKCMAIICDWDGICFDCTC